VDKRIFKSVFSIRRYVLMVALLDACLGWNRPADGQTAAGFMPGERVVIETHNCYPYNGMWADRIDRTLSTGPPVAIELDQAYYEDPKTGTSHGVLAHGQPCTGTEPTLRDYFFEKVRPAVEKALDAEDRAGWPLYTINTNDFRGGGEAMIREFWALLGEYEAWLCTTPKLEDPEAVAPIDVKPILVLMNGGRLQTKVFYDELPVGGRLRAFGSARRTNPLPKATNFRRWLNHSWRYIENGEQTQAGDWTAEEAERLKTMVDNAHKQGYWIRFYTLNGHSPLLSINGWNPSYNFGSEEAVKIRWKACIEAGVDFIATDQCESLAAFMKSKS